MRLLFIAWLLAPPLAAADGEEAKKTYEEQTKTLQELLENERLLRLEIFIQELAETGDPESLDLIFPAVFSIPSKGTYAAARKAISEIEDEEAWEHLVEKVKSSRRNRRKRVDFRHRVLIVDALGMREDESSLRLILELLESKDPRVRRAAIFATRERRRKEAVPALVDLLEENGRRRGRTWLETRDALTHLTGQDFDTVEDWRKFWEISKDSLDPAELESESDEQRTLVGQSPARFFGRAINSHNVIFVIDTSSSMLKWDENEKYQGRNPERDLQRLRLAKKQLASTLKKLPRQTKFNVIAYSDTVSKWQPRLTKASRRSVASAIRFIASFKAASLTHTDDALKEAFKDPRVDTIILLTDGAPFRKDSANSFVVIEAILRWVDNVNPARKIRIDTFGIASPGKWPDVIPGFKGTPPPPPTDLEVASFVDFLKQLSKKTGGIFQKLD